MTIPPATPAESELMALLEPVFTNTYWVDNAIGVIEGISKHGDELNDANHGHFFALIHQFAVDSVVLHTCKLFDRTKNFTIYTVPTLLTYLNDHFTDAYVARLDESILIDLGLSTNEANRITSSLKTRDGFLKAKNDLIKLLHKNMPTCDRNPALKQIFLYRNKVAAHQEALTDALKQQLNELPSIHEIEKLNKWASDFCRFVTTILTNTTLLASPTGARAAALNVVAKILDKNFELSKSGFDYQEWNDFYRRV